MKAEETMGLVATGVASRSFIGRMPLLLAALGPVRASSYRVARRIVNTLRAGYAVPEYAALESCRAIWIAVPDAMLERVLRDLAAQTPIKGALIVLCDSERDSRWPTRLRSKGAWIASLSAVPQTDERVFVTEGDAEAVSEINRLLAAEKRKAIELRPDKKTLYFSGLQFANELVLPWIGGAVESLRAAGFSRAKATTLSELVASNALRAYGRGGRKAWNRNAGVRMRKALSSQLQSIRTADPRLAALYAQGVESACAFFDGD